MLPTDITAAAAVAVAAPVAVRVLHDMKEQYRIVLYRTVVVDNDRSQGTI